MAEKLVGQSLLDKVCRTEHDSKFLSAVGVRDYWPTAAGISRVDVFVALVLYRFLYFNKETLSLSLSLSPYHFNRL